MNGTECFDWRDRTGALMASEIAIVSRGGSPAPPLTEYLSDSDLVAEARLGSEWAIMQLWNRHCKLARSIAWRITRNREDTEDVLQETYINVFRHLEQFKGEAQFISWLGRIATNASLMLLRRRRNRPEVPMDVSEDDPSKASFDFPDLSESVESRCIDAERVEHLRNAIRRLPNRLRQVMELQQGHELQLEEITRITGVSMSAVKSRLFRARAALREAAAQYGQTRRNQQQTHCRA